MKGTKDFSLKIFRIWMCHFFPCWPRSRSMALQMVNNLFVLLYLVCPNNAVQIFEQILNIL